MWLLPWQQRNRIVTAVVVSIVVVFTSDSLIGVSGTEAATDVSPAAVASLSYYCSYDTCQCSVDLRELTCRSVSFTRVPMPLPTTLVKLDLSSNNITELTANSVAELPNLEELILSDNALESIHPDVFFNNRNLKRLSLHNCGLTDVPVHTLQSLQRLTSLNLDQNSIQTIDPASFKGLPVLRSLRLDSNKLEVVPTQALAPLRMLEILNLGNNVLTSLPEESFPHLPNLLILLLKRNQISVIDDNAFTNLTSVRTLELDDNLLTHIPTAVTKLTLLQDLSLSGNRIKYIPGGILQQASGLTLLELKGNPLMGVHPHAFSFLPNLRKLILSDARELNVFPSLNGTSALEVLRLDRASLSAVPPSLCRTCPRLKSLDVKSNKLTKVPDLGGCKDLRVL